MKKPSSSVDGGFPYYHYKFFAAKMIRSTQAARKLTPPSGVMAPSTLIPDRLNTYRLPEKRIVPISINQPDHDKRELGARFPSMTPMIRIPMAWNI